MKKSTFIFISSIAAIICFVVGLTGQTSTANTNRYVLSCSSENQGSRALRIGTVSVISANQISVDVLTELSPYDMQHFTGTWNYSLNPDGLGGTIAEGQSVGGSFISTNDKSLTKYIAIDLVNGRAWMCEFKE